MASSNIYWNSYLPIFFDRMNACMRKHMTELVSDYGLTSAHAIYIIALILNGPMTQKELSVFLDLDNANTNRVIKALKEKGLVYETPIKPGSKYNRIILTDEGESLGNTVMNSTADWMDEQIGVLPTDEIVRMRNNLIAVLRKMDPELDDYMNSSYGDRYYTYLAGNIDDHGHRYQENKRAVQTEFFDKYNREDE